MKNIHHIFSDWNDVQILILENYGIKVAAGYDSFTLEEDQVFWELKPYLDKWQVKDSVITQFSEQELNTAKRLVLSDTWANGYPMPDGNGGYLKTTYEDKDFCKQCGIGLMQKEPFRIKKEPNWGSKKLFSLNWVFDEFFVRRDFYEGVFKKYGIEAAPVLLYKKETVLEGTVQVIIPTTERALNLEGYNYETCKSCNRRRYDLVRQGFFPAFETEVNNLHLFKSKEYFGTGANARKYVFISSELRNELVKNKVKANYIPCE